MNIIWFKDDTKPGQATFYDSNLTLNKVAIKNLEDAQAVLLGIDYSSKQVFVKPCKAGTPNSFKISIAASYGRITNKEFMKEIMRIMDMTFTNPLKLPTTWDQKEEMLVIKLNDKEGK